MRPQHLQRRSKRNMEDNDELEASNLVSLHSLAATLSRKKAALQNSFTSLSNQSGNFNKFVSPSGSTATLKRTTTVESQIPACARLHAVHYITTKRFLEKDNSPVYSYLFQHRIVGTSQKIQNSNTATNVSSSGFSLNQVMRASLIRYSKAKARVSVGKGQIIIELFSSTPTSTSDAAKETHTFEVGSISSIEYLKPNSQNFTLTFLNEGRTFSFKAETNLECIDFLQQLIAELIAQATVYEQAALQLQSNKENNNNKNKNRFVNIIEALLREAVDMWTLCRGTSHPDSTKAQLALATFLETQTEQSFNNTYSSGNFSNNKVAEATFWLDFSRNNVRQYERERKKQLDFENTEQEMFDKLTAFEQLCKTKNHKQLEPRDIKTRVENIIQVVTNGVGVAGLPEKLLNSKSVKKLVEVIPKDEEDSFEPVKLQSKKVKHTTYMKKSKLSNPSVETHSSEEMDNEL